MTETTQRKRLLSLDVLRGLTVAGMILVNSVAGPESFSPLLHAAWNGITFADLVFPLFLFMVGVSTYISLRKFNFKWSGATARKIVKRTVLIILICWVTYWLNWCLYGEYLPFANLRLTGVLVRIAISYGIVALMAVTINHRRLPWIAGALLVAYTAILLLGNGYDPGADNVLFKFDCWLVGLNHIYVPYQSDPEGFLGVLPSVAHVIIGFMCGKLIMETADLRGKMLKLFLVGFTLLALGMALSFGLPLNKRIWSPTFVLFMCGLGASMLAWLMYVLDEKHSTSWTPFFVVFGVNPLFIYVFSEVIAMAFARYGIADVIYNAIAGVVSYAPMVSLLFSLVYVTICWIVGYVLYKRNIYIKI